MTSQANKYSHRDLQYATDAYNQTIKALKEGSISLKDLDWDKDVYPEMAHIAVQQNGLELQYCKHQTIDLVLDALQNNPNSKKYIKYNIINEPIVKKALEYYS